MKRANVGFTKATPSIRRIRLLSSTPQTSPRREPRTLQRPSPRRPAVRSRREVEKRNGARASEVAEDLGVVVQASSDLCREDVGVGGNPVAVPLPPPPRRLRDPTMGGERGLDLGHHRDHLIVLSRSAPRILTTKRRKQSKKERETSRSRRLRFWWW